MKFNSMTLGQFIPGNSPIHDLDPRCKLIGTVVLLTGLFMASSPADFVFWAVLLALLASSARISTAVVLRSARPVWFLVLITVIINLFWGGGEALFSIGFIKITREGIITSFSMGMRLFFLVVFASLLMMTTSPMAFSDGLERLLSPLARVGFPASEMAMMMTIALRFIPTLFEETDRILKAQISRGADFESGGLIKRAKSFIPVLVPLFVLVFQRAENLATAMESRCYKPGQPRSRLNPLVWTKRDTASLLLLTLLIAAIVAADRLYLRDLIS